MVLMLQWLFCVLFFSGLCVFTDVVFIAVLYVCFGLRLCVVCTLFVFTALCWLLFIVLFGLWLLRFYVRVCVCCDWCCCFACLFE